MDENIVQKLREVLADDPVAEVRREAARALGSAAGAGADVVGPLVAALDDTNDGVRRAATLSLGRVRDPRGAQALMRTLAERPELWEEASAALGTAGDDALLGDLLSLTSHESTQVRRGAVRAIAAVSRRRHGELSDDPLFVYTDAEGHRHPLF